jgi:hypothetical protein
LWGVVIVVLFVDVIVVDAVVVEDESKREKMK